ncbi:MAG: amidohydrolase family protein [Salinirussus sp.]
MAHDLLLADARVVDGTGAPWYRGHVGIDDGRIDAVYRGEPGSAEERIDLDGDVVAPGFIDAHSHSDLELFANPSLQPKIRQGITTEILGQDGFSMAPMYRDDGAARWEDHLSGLDGRLDREWEWGSMDEYMAAIEDNGIAPNVAPLVGHGTVRFNVLGMADDAPTAGEREEMAELVRESLDDGAVGLSTGLVYAPQYHASTAEVRAMAEALAPYGRPFVAHIRDERLDIWDAMDEFADIGAETGVPLHHSHFKVVGPLQSGKADRAVELVEVARERGIDYLGDMYPYRAGSTMLSALLPPWAVAGSTSETLDRLRDPETRTEIRRDVEEWRLEDWHNPGKYIGWDAVVIASVGPGGDESVVGETVAAVAEDRDVDPVEAVCDVLLETELDATMTLHQLEEDDVRTVVQAERICIGTDGIFGGGKPHPRLYGTYPRVLETYVREENLLTLEAAVRKMTSLPARSFGLDQKGLVRPGMDADLVVFDPTFIGTTATYESPRRYPEGLPHVIVGGEFVVRDGESTGALPGAVVRA